MNEIRKMMEKKDKIYNKASIRRMACWFSGLGLWVVIASLVACVGISFVGAASFDEQRKIVAVAPEKQSESLILALLKAGIEEGKPTQAIAETQKWLRQNLPEDVMFFYYAGKASELSGDWKGAVALYQQYLKKADLKSATASDACIAVYTILINQLNDDGAAYAFGRNQGHRLSVNARARQFDKWFLDGAVKRKDMAAIADRLYSCIKAGVSDDILTVRYGKYLRVLLGEVDTYLIHGVPVTEELVASYKQLASVLKFNDEMGLRLDWAVSVKAYNLAKAAGEDVFPPIAEAKALLAKYPRYAKWVQDGWAGGGHGRYYRDGLQIYWPHEVEAKMAVIVEAAPRLTPLQLADLQQSWRSGYYADNVVRILDVKVVSDYLLANPKLTSGRTGLYTVKTPWDKFSPEEAQKIAPQLAQNPDPNAALIRAIAAGGKEKDYDKMVAAITGLEAWRLDVAELDSRFADQLWHDAGRPGGAKKRDEGIKRSKAVAAKIKATAVKPEAPAVERIAAFRKLWADYRSARPKIPGVVSQLKAVLLFTPEVIPELLKDSSPEAQMLARTAIASGMSGPNPLWKDIEAANKVNVNSYAPGILYLAQRHRGMAELKTRYPEKCKPHPLESALRKSLSDGLKRNKLEPWQVMAWINMQYPEDNAEQVKLMHAICKSPLGKTMPFEIKYAATEWFKEVVMTPAQLAVVKSVDATLLCKDLLALPKEADLTTTLAAFSKALEGVEKAPGRIDIQGLEQLALVEDIVFTNSQVMALSVQVASSLRTAGQSNLYGARLLKAVSAQRDPILFHQMANYIWRYARFEHYSGPFPVIKDLAESLIDEQPSSASSLARVGLLVFDDRQSHGSFRREDLAILKSIRGKAAMNMGLMVIPVVQSDPAYPIYKSQADWLSGNDDSAWEMCEENWDQLLPLHRELSIEYLNWVLQRVIYGRDELRQEELVKALLAWSGEVSTPISLTQKIELEIAYGDIALQRGMLPEAHAIFVKTQNNKAYSGLPVVHQATLRRAMTERISKNFDAALNTLNELDMQRVPAMWAATRYARAEVYFDMEEYDDATEQIDAILQRMPNHAEAKLMGGKLFIARRRWMEASELDIGPEGEENTLVPGEMLKVTLNDHTLAVSGAGTEIEVAVWTTSGDKERFLLRQFGDVKTKFRGEVLTELGPPAPEDRILQLIGDDEIYFAYSERFRKKMNNMEEKRGGPITVASDAILMASARVLLSESEQLVADRERLNEILEDKDGMRAERLDAKTIESYNAQIKASNERRMIMTRVKPGNPIHVRVIDPDRSRTKDIDQLEVGVESSSGDSIGRVTLKETGTHTGWFEGSIPTTGAQAMAFANSSEPGRNPNMVISPTPGYPAWRPVGEKGETPDFKVDLNDNVKLGELKISAKENGSKLKKFILQTGMNDKSMEVVGVYPVNTMSVKHPWQPSVTVINDTDHHHARNDRSVYDIRELEEHMARGWITQVYAAGVADNVTGPSAAMNPEIPGKVKWLRQNRSHNAHVIYRFRGYFYEPADVTRRFKVELGKFDMPKVHPSVAHPAQYMLAIDGRIITDKEKMDKLEGEINLKSGLHRFEIWATGWDCRIGFGRTVKLQSNLDQEDVLVDCPDDFFNPKNFPQGTLAHRNAPAAITANADGSEFTVKFAPDSRARLLNLVFLEQDGPLPALNKLTLTSSDGAEVLPVKEDYAKLNKNETLEILTGDKVAVRYVDDRFVSKSKQKLERFLNVSFTSARMQFEFFEMRKDRGGEDVEYFEKKLRFVHGKPMTLTINDADMDVSPEPDKVFCTIENQSGTKSRFEAVESGPSTGIFRLTITPVEGAPTNKLQIQVANGDALEAIYRDEENMAPGVPIDRVATIAHAAYSTPVLNLAHATVTAIDPKELPASQGLHEGFYKMDPEEYHSMSFAERHEWSKSHGNVQARWLIKSKMLPVATPPTNGFEVVDGRHMYLEVVAPHLALRKGSNVKVYVQTDSGRKLFKSNRAGSASPLFDINVPGTVELDATLFMLHVGHWNDPWRLTPQIATYLEEKPSRDLTAKDMRFTCEVPLVAGVLPEYGVLDRAERAELAKLYVLNTEGLVVRAGERVHVGFRYEDEKGAEQWLTASSKVTTHPVLDLMQEGYRAGMRQVFVGENLYPRVVDLGADKTDQPDKVRVLLQAKSGAKHFVELTESGIHTGVFKAIFATTYADTPAKSGASTKAYDVRRQGFPVVYGDDIGARYTDSNGFKTPVPLVKLGKGSDGTVTPFSKKYEDSDTAMNTQFALAESYLELAKRHRKMGETIIAKVEFERAKQLLANAISRFNDPETRANAEYLLGNLTMEEADTTADADLKKRRYHAALARFMTVTSTYQDTFYASMAQFKIAVTYERLKEPDIAAQEYVKLAYKYPESQHLALSMLRLGTHFQRKAYKFELKADALLKKVDDKDAQHEGQAMRIISNREYVKSAKIFGRLQLRFPGHEHAGKAGLKAGQAYMRAGETQDALATFRRVVANEGYDGKSVRSQAMYWTGICYQKLKDQMAAFSIYKRLTYDFPESKWSSYANGQLQQDTLLRIGDKIEMQQLEAEGER